MHGERWVVGDIHGHYEKAVRLLADIGMLDDSLDWAGGDSELYFIGDLTDRGPQGLETIDLVMRIQRQASDSGGRVECLMGNHEIFLLGAKMHPDQGLGPADYTLWDLWYSNGGVREDLDGLTDRHLDWISMLPSVMSIDGHLLIHADSPMYAHLGNDAGEVNAAVSAVLRNESPEQWDALITSFVRRNELWDNERGGEDAIAILLKTFGGDRIVHGHTPIPLLTRQNASTVTEPLIYSGGRCVNVDGGMFLGGPGFAYALDK